MKFMFRHRALILPIHKKCTDRFYLFQVGFSVSRTAPSLTTSREMGYFCFMYQFLLKFLISMIGIIYYKERFSCRILLSIVSRFLIPHLTLLAPYFSLHTSHFMPLLSYEYSLSSLLRSFDFNFKDICILSFPI